MSGTGIDPRELRDAFGCFMTGVTVVTCLDAADKPVGFTANSFSSVSLEPPLVQVSIAKSSSNLSHFEKCSGFAVNVLAENQIGISNRFARPSEDRFAETYWRKGPVGAPIFADVSAWFDCTLAHTVDAGDHVILIGQVGGFEASAAPGLGYYRGAYITPATTARDLPLRPEVFVCAVVQHEGSVLLVDDGRGGTALPMMPVGEDGVQVSLSRLLADHGCDAAVGGVYSIYEDTRTRTQTLAIRCPARRPVAAKGAFVALGEAAFDDLSDFAVRDMLERLLQEMQDGVFGVYFGDHTSGQVSRPGVREVEK